MQKSGRKTKKKHIVRIQRFADEIINRITMDKNGTHSELGCELHSYTHWAQSHIACQNIADIPTAT